MTATQKKNEVTAKKIMTDFLISYIDKPKKFDDRAWLTEKISEHLPSFSRPKIEIVVEDIFKNSATQNFFLEDVYKSAEHECTPEIWMYKKILIASASSDENFLQELFEKNKILQDINLWLLETLDDLKKINFDAEGQIFFDEDRFEEISGDRKNFNQPSKSKKNFKSDKNFLTKEAVGNNLNKALLNQFQRSLKTDLGHLNLKTHDLDDLAMSFGKNAALNGVGGIAVTTMLAVIMQSGLKSKSRTEILKILMQAGSAQGIKTATAGALKVVAEKNLLPILSRTTPLIVIATLAGIVIESFKIIMQREKGKLTSLEAADKIGRVTTAAIFSVGFATAGRIAGLAAFSVIPVAGPVVGGIVGSLIGEIAGSLIGGKVGDFSYTKAKNIVSVLTDFMKLDYRIAATVNLKITHLAKQKIYS